MILENHFLLVDFARITYDSKFPFIRMYIHEIGKELILIFDQNRVQYKNKTVYHTLTRRLCKQCLNLMSPMRCVLSF